MTILKNYQYPILLTASMFGLTLFNDTHWPRWFAFLSLFIIVFSFVLWRKAHWTLGLVSLATLTSGILAAFPQIKYFKLHPIEQIALAEHAMRGTLYFVAFCLLGLMLTRSTLIKLMTAYVYMVLAHCVFSFAQLFAGIHIEEATGLFPNISMGSSLVAVVAAPTLLVGLQHKSIKHILFSCLMIANVMTFASSMAWLILTIGLALTALFYFKNYKKYVLSAFILAAMIGLGDLVDYQWSSFLHIDRFQFWPKLTEWWLNRGDIWIGTGTGTFAHIGPNLQQALGFKTEQGYWHWIHSDMLQILFEIGILGFVSVLLFVGHVLYKVLKNEDYALFILLTCFSVMTIGNYPLRLAEFAFFGMVIFTTAIKFHMRKLYE